MKLRNTLVAAVSALALAACGGGGETTTPASPAPNAGGTGTPVNNPAPGAAPGAAAPGGAAPGAATTPAEAPQVTEANNVSLGGLAGSPDLFTAQASFQEDNSAATETAPDASTILGGGDAAGDDATTTTTIRYVRAKIYVNGVLYNVRKGNYFPDSQQFQLEDLTATTATISLTAGQFGNGGQGVELKKGKTYTFVNQSEGLTYTIKLKSVTASATTTTTGGSSTAAGGMATGFGF